MNRICQNVILGMSSFYMVLKLNKTDTFFNCKNPESFLLRFGYGFSCNIYN